MKGECSCDLSSDENSFIRKEEEEDEVVCNRIFLNFTREIRNPLKDNYNTIKVKELFKCIGSRPDIQALKVSGRLDDKTEEVEEEEENEVGEFASLEGNDESPKGGGQRFAMSRDFWYRKLNTLKAQKLDEAALEARDLPPTTEVEAKFKDEGHKILSYEIPEEKQKILKDIDKFTVKVAKPAEKVLRHNFVNVYNNRNHWKIKGKCSEP